DLPGCGVDGSGVIAPAVKREHALRRGVINDRVRVLAGGLDFGERFQSLQIVYRDGVRPAVAGVALAQVRRKSRAMNALRIRQIADYFAADLLTDHNMSAPGNVEAMFIGIHSQIIPSSLASHRDPSQHFIAL